MAQQRPRSSGQNRRRAMNQEAARRLKRQREREQRRKIAESKEAAKGPIDIPFLLLAMLLLVIGLIMLLSASFPTAQASSRLCNNPLFYFRKQFGFALLGLALMSIIAILNYERFRGAADLAILVSVGLLILVIIPGNNQYGRLLALGENGAARWLGIPNTSLTFQPSEVAKLGVIVYFAEQISQRREKMNDLTSRDGAGPLILLMVFMAGIVAIEPHLSGAILLFGMSAAMMVAGGVNAKLVFVGVVGVA